MPHIYDLVSNHKVANSLANENTNPGSQIKCQMGDSHFESLVYTLIVTIMKKVIKSLIKKKKRQ